MAARNGNGSGKNHAPVSIDTAAAPPINWGDLGGKTPPPPTWWIQDWLGAQPTLVAGKGGAGKTTLWQTIATSLATGKQFLAPSVRNLNVLMWLCEDSKDDAWRRQHRINAHFDLEYEDLEQLHIVPRMGCDNTLLGMSFGAPVFTRTFDELKEQVEDLHIDALVLDNIAQVFGANENDRHQVTKFVNGVGGLITERPFAAVFLGHPGRGEKSEFSGSTAWENAMRMRWYLGPTLPDQEHENDDCDEKDTDVMYLAKRKSNYSSKDWRRLKFQDRLLVPETHEPGFRFDQAYRNEGAERVVLSAISKLKTIGINVTDGATSPDYLPTQIIAKGYAEGHTKKEIAAAMNRLMGQQKLLRAVVGQYANRSPRYGLTVSM